MNAPPETRLRAVIVDDEPPSRRKLRRLLERDPQIEVVGEADSGQSAIDVIRGASPDVVFLDVQMGKMGGFDVLAALDPTALPQIVFVTAADESTLKAFEVAVVDYLLKPFDAARLQASVARVKDRLRTGATRELEAQLHELLATVERITRGT